MYMTVLLLYPFSETGRFQGISSEVPPSLLPSSVMMSRSRSKAFSKATIFWMAALFLVSCWSNSKPWTKQSTKHKVVIYAELKV